MSKSRPRSLSPERSGELVRLVLGLPVTGERISVGVAVRSDLQLDGFELAGELRFEEIRQAREKERGRERSEKQGRESSVRGVSS